MINRLTGPIGTPLDRRYFDLRLGIEYRLVYDPERRIILKQPVPTEERSF